MGHEPQNSCSTGGRAHTVPTRSACVAVTRALRPVEGVTWLFFEVCSRTSFKQSWVCVCCHTCSQDSQNVVECACGQAVALLRREAKQKNSVGCCEIWFERAPHSEGPSSHPASHPTHRSLLRWMRRRSRRRLRRRTRMVRVCVCSPAAPEMEDPRVVRAPRAGAIHARTHTGGGSPASCVCAPGVHLPVVLVGTAGVSWEGRTTRASPPSVFGVRAPFHGVLAPCFHRIPSCRPATRPALTPPPSPPTQRPRSRPPPAPSRPLPL